VVVKQARVIESTRVNSPAVDSLRVLLSTYLFQDLSPAELEPLVKALHSREYLRGEYVFRAGDTAEFLYILAVGEIKYSINTAEGDEWILEIMTPGAVFGEPGLFAPERTRIVDALAIQRSSVLVIGRGRLVDFMQEHRPAMMRMLEALASEGRLTIETVTEIGYLQILERVQRKLLELATTHGQAREDGGVEIALSVSQATLAGLVGATRESVNRALSILAADGRVQVVKGRFRIADLASLRRNADREWTPLHRRNRLATQLLGEQPRR
jgi:CRP-like cAMP-binding protein